MVIGVMSHLLQVVVLSAHSQAFLRVHPAHVLAGALGSQYDILPLVHTGIGKHQGGVILDYHRGGGHHAVSLALEVLLE